MNQHLHKHSIHLGLGDEVIRFSRSWGKGQGHVCKCVNAKTAEAYISMDVWC